MTAAGRWRDWFPYGDAFRFVDEVVELETRRIVTLTHYGRRPDLVEAHRIGGRAVVPGVLLAEQAAQSALILGRCSGWIECVDQVVLGRMNCTFERRADGGAAVECEVSVQLETPTIAAFRARLTVDGEAVARVLMAARRNAGPA